MHRVKQFILGKYFWLSVVAVLAISRAATWLFPFDSDHWIFYYIGRKWAEGSVLYVDIWDHKSPLIFLYNAFLYTVFGGNIVIHRIFFTLIALLAIYVFYITARLLYQLLKIKNADFVTKISTLVFTFFTSLSQFTNSGNNNENLGILFLLLTFYLYLYYKKNIVRNQNYLLASGLFAGFVFMLKANFAILLLPIVIDLVIVNWKNIYRLIGSVAFFVFGILLQLMFWTIYFRSAGTFKDFFTATFEFNSKYMKALGWDLGAPGLIFFIGILILLLAFFAPSIIKTLAKFKKPDELGYLLPLMAASTILFIVFLGTFYSHYFLVIIPYFCFIFGTEIATLKKTDKVKIIYYTVIAILLLGISYKQLYNNFFGPVATDYKNQKVVADYVTTNSQKTDKIFAYIYGATFYRLSDRDSGSRFVSASHLLIDYKYKLGYHFNSLFIADMEKTRPKYIILSSDQNDIYRKQNPIAMAYFSKHYKLEKTFNGYLVVRRVN